jgi:hypothetical protein
MRLSRTAAVVGTTLLIGGLAATASAAGNISPNVIDATQPSSTITVNWSGITIPAGLSNVVFIDQCYKNDAGVFNPATDCSQATGINPDFAGGTGSATYTVFNGDDPNGTPFGCGPLTTAGTAKGTANGVDTCWVRLSPGNQSNTATDEFYPFTFGPPAGNVPEVPLNVLLPTSAAAVLGASLLIARRRQMKTVA